MDVDIWGQLAVESSQVYLTDGTLKKSQFADTVYTLLSAFYINLYMFIKLAIIIY